MATPIRDTMTDNSVKDGTDDPINGSEVDANPNSLADILDGTSAVELNTAATPLMQINNPIIANTQAAAGGVRTAVRVRHNPASGTVSDNDGVEILLQGDDDGGNITNFGEIEVVFTDVSDTTEDANMIFKVMVAGTSTAALTLNTTTATFAGGITSGGNIVSDTDSTDDLGTSSVRWANVYTDSIGDTGQALTIGATALTIPTSSTWTVGTGGTLNIALSSAAGDDFTVDTNKLVVEGDTGNVGIGTSSPAYPFHVVNAGGTIGNYISQDAVLDANARAFYVYSNSAHTNSGSHLAFIVNDNASSTNTAFRVDNAGSGSIMELYDGGSIALAVVDGGEVMIGTSTAASSEKLHVYDNTAASIPVMLVHQDNASATGGAMTITNDGTGPNITLNGGSMTESVTVEDAGSASATEQDWIEVKVGGVTGYIRVYATK